MPPQGLCSEWSGGATKMNPLWALQWGSSLGHQDMLERSQTAEVWKTPRHRKVTSYTAASQSQETTRPEVTDRSICVAEAASSPPLRLPSASLLGLLPVAAAAYIRSEADGSGRTPSQPAGVWPTTLLGELPSSSSLAPRNPLEGGNLQRKGYLGVR